MKKVLLWSLVLTFVMAMPQLIKSADAKDVWKTYNLIKDGQLNTSKWSFNDRQIGGVSIVTMSIAGDHVKFVHRPDTNPASGGGSVWLQLIKNAERVKGIQVEITMGTVSDPDMPLNGNLRARIGNTAGAYGAAEDYVWNQLSVLNRLDADGGDRIYGAMDLEDPKNDYEWIYNPIYCEFNHPEEVDGSTYLLTMILDREKKTVNYTVEGFGTVTYTMPEKLVPGWETFWGIGTRSQDALGSGTVWFGNEVKVLIDGDIDADQKRPIVKKTVPGHKEINVDVAIDQIKIKFNEAMTMWYHSCGDDSCCPKVYKKDEGGIWQEAGVICEWDYKPTKTFSFTVPAEAGDLDYGTWWKIRIPQDYFIDLAGNGNEEFSFKFKSEPAP